MMQRLLTKYALVIHIAVLVLCPVLYVPQLQMTNSLPLLWLSLFAVELMVLLPAVRREETLSDARQRVIRSLVWDPFLYLGLAIIGVVAVQWFNSGSMLVYRLDIDAWEYSKPYIAWLPSCVDADSALSCVSLFSACVAVGVILRVAVSRSAKRFLLQGLAFVSGLAALFFVWQSCMGVEPYAVKNLTRGTAAVGTLFGFWMVLGLGLFIEGLAQCQRGMKSLFLIGVIGNLLGTLFFASAIALVGYVTLCVLLFFYGLIYLRHHVAKHVQLKLFISFILLLSCFVLVFVFVFPSNPVIDKVKQVIPVETYWAKLIEVTSIRTTAAAKIWQEHPWMGIGADGFRRYVGFSVVGKDWGLLKSDPAVVYNDCLQFLCEFGVLGAGLLLAAVIALMASLCYRTRVAWKNGISDDNGSRLFILKLSPIVLTGVLATLACFVESWIACPFRSQAILLSWICVLAALPAFLPARTHSSEPKG